MDCTSEIILPQSVAEMLREICVKQSLPPPGIQAREQLARLGEQVSLKILREIARTKVKSLTGFILYMARNTSKCSSQECVHFSGPQAVVSSSGEDEASVCSSRQENAFTLSQEQRDNFLITNHLRALGHLEFKKAFLILSYIGKNKLEDVLSVDQIYRWKDFPMAKFESEVWRAAKQQNISPAERKNFDWNCGKAFLYHCHVDPDGKLAFKGPYLDRTRTHLQNVLGDDKVLVVKFSEEAVDEHKLTLSSPNIYSIYHSIAKEGILVGLRRYRFFVFKDGGKEEKKKNPNSSPVKCYFVCTESHAASDEKEPYILFNKSIHEARSLFMHAHTASSLSKYMARFALILSKTIKLEVDLAAVNIQTVEDIPCLDQNKMAVFNDNGEPLIHTDGTGFISEDLAMKCPRNIFQGWCLKGNRGAGGSEDRPSTYFDGKYFASTLPLLIQFRLFDNGRAVKGTVLIDKRLPPNTIQIRRSMEKIERDRKIPNIQTVNSFEIVGTSNPPRTAYLSRNLITLLSYGGVPKEFFMELLRNALNDVQNVYYSTRAALAASLRVGERSEEYLVSRMISCGIPLDEPYLQHRLSILLREERKRLKDGKVQLSDCYYLMGTADPTGKLRSNQVCVILDRGQITGDVLVYKNPGLHFGDIHVFNATRIDELEGIVGDAKYAIFFPVQGPRSAADEIANSDFDGDLYWVSENQKLLALFKTSKPWEHPASEELRPQPMPKPTQFSEGDLEKELFQLYLENRFQRSNPMSTAADSWLVFMDRLLTLGDECADEKHILRKKMLQLVNIYYDALDAQKSGKKVVVPSYLKPEKFPHFMERKNSYLSTSILGLIYNEANSCPVEDLPDKEIWLLPCFNEEVPQNCIDIWKQHYDRYKPEMCIIMALDDESKNPSAEELIRKYKQILYDAAEFEESKKPREEIFKEAMAIYQITYQYAKEIDKSGNCGVSRCSFAWKVAGHALCQLYAEKQNKCPIVFSPNVLRQLFN